MTGSNLHDNDSVVIHEVILARLAILLHERIHVFNINNSQRFERCAIKGKGRRKEFILNGATARLDSKGDQIIITA